MHHHSGVFLASGCQLFIRHPWLPQETGPCPKQSQRHRLLPSHGVPDCTSLHLTCSSAGTSADVANRCRATGEVQPLKNVCLLMHAGTSGTPASNLLFSTFAKQRPSLENGTVFLYILPCRGSRPCCRVRSGLLQGRHDMAEPVVAQKSPFGADVEAGKSYWWCACGRSQSQPYCDGSHKGTGFSPEEFRAEKTGTVWFCGCKHTNESPLCDGSHKTV